MKHQLLLRVDESLTNDLPAEERDKLRQALEGAGRVFERILKEREVLAEKGVTTSQAFNFLAEHMHDTESFYRVLSGSLGPTDDEEFPF